MSTGKAHYPLLLALLVAQLVGFVSPVPAKGQESPFVFEEIAEQGFGDRQNTKAWSMVWWQDHLYVGTARAHLCMNWAGLSILGLRPGWVYPPLDTDLDCTADYRDLPLRAEIWRYTPASDTWTRVFISELVQNPADPTRQTARDIGFRNFVVFPEPGGGEALYAAGITSESLNPGMPPPRLLRTTNGVDWAPVPQEPGTVFGDLKRRQANLRAAAVYKGRFYIVAGDLQGTGPLLEAANPAGGNDEFRFVTSEDLHIFELIEYGGSLYMGLGTVDGYEVVKTDAEGPGPYELTPVVQTGGGIPFFTSKGVASMHISKGRLYVGTDKPAELIRINPDDTWDLIVGKPRWARGTGGKNDSHGWKEPLSGFESGFDYLLTNHFHRMDTYDDTLFLSTNDGTGFVRVHPNMARFLPNMGFDLYVSSNGVEFSALTLTGFDHPFDIVMRVWEPTPHGLFAGTSNGWNGLRMYRARPAPTESAPKHLMAEEVDGSAVLTWEGVAGASLYRIFRRHTGEGPRFAEIGTTTNTFFVDSASSSAKSGATFHYYVVSERQACCRSAPSNFTRWPNVLNPMTPLKLSRYVKRWVGGRRGPVNNTLYQASILLRQGELEGARALLLGLESQFESSTTIPAEEPVSLRAAVMSRLRARDLRGALELVRQARRARVQRTAAVMIPAWRAEDFNLLLGRLSRRLQLVDAGILTPQELNDETNP